MSPTQQQVPSPYATHADLSALRRELREDIRDFMADIRDTLHKMETNSSSRRDSMWNLAFSVGNLIVWGVYVAYTLAH